MDSGRDRRHRGGMRTALFIIALSVSIPAAAREVVGTVVAVVDGDTIDVREEGRPAQRVRLAEIDAPEKAQPFGAASKRMLSSLAFGREVIFQAASRDRNGRWIARVRAGTIDLSAEMVRRGGAWRYVQYSGDGMFVSYEAEARMAKLGLWALPAEQRTPPWEWRRRGNAVERSGGETRPRRRSPEKTGSAAPVIRRAACAEPRYCREMSCAEAFARLKACGPDGIDGDRDGKPCETKCGY